MDRKIAIEFDQKIRNEDVSTVDPARSSSDHARIASMSASSEYSGYPASRVIDGNTGTYWRANSTTAPQWVQADLKTIRNIHTARVYLNSYRPNQFELLGSNDAATWDVVYAGNFANVSGWQEFPVSGQYRYWRVNCLSKYSTYYYIYEIELIGYDGQEAAFTATGEEYQWEGAEGYGSLVSKTYNVLSVERYADNAILLNIDPNSRFNDATEITVSYDAAKGDLRGFGSVESFSVSFVPTDLVPIRDPMFDEHVTARVSDLTLTLTRVYYTDNYHEEHVTARVTNLMFALTRVTYNNP